MNSTTAAASPAPPSAASDWAGRLESAVQQERVFWTPPGGSRVDASILFAPSPATSVAQLENLLGSGGRCELALPDIAREQAAVSGGGGVVSQLRRLVFPPGATEFRPAATIPGDAREQEVFLGFPFLWVPPGFSEGGQSPPILLPLGLLPVDVTFDPVAASVTLSVRAADAGCPLEPNPVFLRWLEMLTQQPLPQALREGPAELWPRLEWLMGLADSALGTPGNPHSVQPFQAFPPIEQLPFAPAILPVAVLGRFPSAAPAWQIELRELLPRRDIPVGPARWFLGQELPSGLAGLRRRGAIDSNAAPSCEQLARGPENPALATAVERTREAELSVVYAPDPAARWEAAATFISECLTQDQRVLVLASPSTVAAFRGVLAGRGLQTVAAEATESPLGGAALRRDMLRRFSQPPPPEAEFPPGESFDVSAHELRWQQLHGEVATAARALHAQGPDGVSFGQLMAEWLELYGIVPPDSGEPVEPPQLTELVAQQEAILTLFRDAQMNQYGLSAWREGLAEPTPKNLARPASEWEQIFTRLVTLAGTADSAAGAGLLPFSTEVPLTEQATLRRLLAEKLEPLTGWDRPHFFVRVATAQPAEIEALVRQRETLAESARELFAQRLDGTLLGRLHGEIPTLAVVATELRRLDAPPVRTWPWANRGAPGSLTRQLGLRITGTDRELAQTFLRGLYHRLQLEQMVNAWLNTGKGEGLDDGRLRQDWQGTGELLELARFLETPEADRLRGATLSALQEPARLPEFIANLRQSADSVQSGAEFEAGIVETGLFLPEVLQRWRDDWNHGEKRVPFATRLRDHHQLLPAALAFDRAVRDLPASLQPLVRWHARRGAAADVSLLALRRAAMTAELTRRRAQSPELQSVSAGGLESALTELSQLIRRRRRQLSEQAQRRWSSAVLKHAAAAPVPSPEEILSGRALLALRPLWITTPTQALELFAPRPMFDLLLVLPEPGDSLAEVLPTLLRSSRAVIVATAAMSVPAPEFSGGGRGGDDDDVGPGLLEVVPVLGVPVLQTGGPESVDFAGDASRSAWPPLLAPAPLSRVHPVVDAARPTRTAAALGALLRNQFDLSTEVHWADPAGVVDLALRDPAEDPNHRAGWLVDLPDWTSRSVPATAEEAHLMEALVAAGWQVTRVWTPDLVPDPVPILMQLLAHSGIVVRPRGIPADSALPFPS